MPLYEYTCQSCSQHVELLIRGSESPACPHCGSEELAKQFSVPAAHVRGSQSLPIGGPAGGLCGRPQCAQGGCQGLD